MLIVTLCGDVTVGFDDDDDNDEMEPVVNYCSHQRHESLGLFREIQLKNSLS